MRLLETPELSRPELTLPKLVGAHQGSFGRRPELPSLNLPLRTGPELLEALLAGEGDVQLVELLVLLEHLRLLVPQGELADRGLPQALVRMWTQDLGLRTLTIAWLLSLRLGDGETGAALSAAAGTAPEPIGVLLGPAPFRVIAESCRGDRSAPSSK